MIRLRVEHTDISREYAFHRARIRIGRSPMNDLTIPVAGVSARHVALELSDNALVMSPLSELARTVILRESQSLNVDGERHVLPGDVLILGEGVRLILLGVQDEASEDREALRLPLDEEVSVTEASVELRMRLLPLSLEQQRKPDLSSLLAQLEPVVEAAFEERPQSTQLLQLSDGSEPERLFELTASGALEPAHDTLETGSNKRTEVVELVRQGGLVHYPSQGGHVVLLSPIRGCHAGGVALALRFGPLPSLERSSEERRQKLSSWVQTGSLIAPILASVARQRRAMRTVRHLDAENRYFRDRQRRHYLFKELVTESAAMQTIYSRLNAFVLQESPVLLVGEAGTGKELLARALHHLGSRNAGLMVAQNCAELDENMLDIELFGGVGGTIGDRMGIFELADGGTVYLDEIGKLPPRLQLKVLRVIKEGEIRRHGEQLGRAVNVRIIASTHTPLAELVTGGTFRKDLLVALSDSVIPVPPLRDRQKDILPLLHIFLDLFARRYDLATPEVSAEAKAALCAYRWPGNVRELQSAVESAVLKRVDRVLEAGDFGILEVPGAASAQVAEGA